VAQTGSIRVAVSTTGDEGSLDGNGFAVVVDAFGPQAIAINATMTLPDLAVGAHTVRLDGVADNCAVAGENPRTVTVTANGTAEVAFTVTCGPATGSIEVTTVTVGGTDADGYTIAVDGGAAEPIGTAETRAFAGLSPGTHEVQLAELDGGCTVNGENPRALVVIGNRATSTTFDIACPISGIGGRIAFYSDRDGDWEIFVMNADGSNVTQLTFTSGITETRFPDIRNRFVPYGYSG
jgi:hypothetical protein